MSNQRFARSAGTVAALAVMLAGVAGCALPARMPVPSMPDPVTAGGGLNATAERMILVTVANPSTLLIGEPGSTPHGYDAIGSYAVSDQAKATGAALGRDYGLRQVREWPIAPLGVECLVFALPPETDREALLQRLAADRRVRLAQPLQVFNALGDPAGTGIESGARPGAAGAPPVSTSGPAFVIPATFS